MKRAPVVVALCTLAACAASGGASGGTSALRLGYYPNLTHATAIVGIEKGYFARRLSPTRLVPTTFNAGGDVVAALFSDTLDAAFIGPSPAINAWTQSGGRALRIVSGATSGGAFLVVRPNIGSPADLAGKTLATPQLGNTQDVALRAWLRSKGLRTTLQGGGDVEIVPQPNAQTLASFVAGTIKGAWVPEPWATRLVREGGGRVLVDERDIRPSGRFATTLLVVRTGYLEAHRDAVSALLDGLLDADVYIHAHPARARSIVAGGIRKATGKSLAPEVLETAWDNLTFTVDPVARSLGRSASDAYSLGLLRSRPDLRGIFSLGLLNERLAARGRPAVR